MFIENLFGEEEFDFAAFRSLFSSIHLNAPCFRYNFRFSLSLGDEALGRGTPPVAKRPGRRFCLIEKRKAQQRLKLPNVEQLR